MKRRCSALYGPHSIFSCSAVRARHAIVLISLRVASLNSANALPTAITVGFSFLRRGDRMAAMGRKCHNGHNEE